MFVDSYKDIAPISWTHPHDVSAFRQIKLIPGLAAALDWLGRDFAHDQTQQWLRQSTYVPTPQQYPQLLANYDKCLQLFDCPQAYPLRILPTNQVQAYAVGTENPAVVISEGAIASYERPELLFVLGHELSHILSEHIRFKMLLRALFMASWVSVTIPITTPIILALRIALVEWDHKSELSADRAGVLACGNAIYGQRALVKTILNTPEKIDIDDFLRFNKKAKDNLNWEEQFLRTLHYFSSTHPDIEERCREMKEWEQSETLQEIQAGTFWRRSHPTEKLSEQDFLAWQAATEEVGGVEDIEELTSPNMTQIGLGLRRLFLGQK